VAPRKGPWEGAPHPAFPDATARTFRILPIAADLLPPEIAETRHVRRVRRLVISAVVLVAALVVGWYGVTVRTHSDAEADRQSILDTSQDLTRQKHKQYDELTRIQSDSGKIDDRLRKVLAYDLSWSKLLASLRSTAAAKNVRLNGVTAALNQDALVGKAASDVIGTVTLTGTAQTKAAVAAYVDALGTVPGVTDPFPSDTTQETTGVAFTIHVDITKAALGGRFTSAAPSASPSGSK
jgi:Tfp pilus assembly protein PilN